MDEARIASAAAANHGVLSKATLNALGVTDRQIERRVGIGRWRKLHSGAFAIAAAPDSFDLRAAAALASVGGSALSHLSAAQVHGFDCRRDPTVHLIADLPSMHVLTGVRIHRCGSIPQRHLVRRGGHLVTTVERTLVDLGAVLGPQRLQRCLEDQVLSRSTTLERVTSVFMELARRGRPGIARVRAVLEAVEGLPPSESELEAMFWQLLTSASLPLPLRQQMVGSTDASVGRVDFHYPDHALIVELDGRRFHGRTADFERDRKRDQLAVMSGQRVLRFTFHQVRSEPAFVVNVVRSLLSSASNFG